MSKIVMKDATPVGNSPLCRTCTNALMMRGYRESEQLTMCDHVHPNIVVPFVVYECSGYYDKNRPSYKQMEDLALHIDTGPIKPRGFKTGFTQTTVTVGPRKDDDCDEDDD